MNNKSVEDIVNILSRNTIDGSAVEQTLISASVQNFKTLYEIQLDTIGFHRIDVPITEFDRIYRTTQTDTNRHYPHRYRYRVPYTILSGDSRRKCKDAQFYGKEMTQEEISSYTDIFDFNYLLFIEGNMIDTSELIFSDTDTQFILDVSTGEGTAYTDGIPMEKYLEYVDKESVVTIMILPNYKMAKASFNVFTFKDVLKYAVDYSRFEGDTSAFIQDETIFFMNTIQDKSLKDGIPCTVDVENKKVIVPEDINITSTKLELESITLEDIYEIKKFKPGDSRWFQLTENYTTPLPVENVIPFVRNSDGGLQFDNQVKLKLYYPNIYHIENWDETSELTLFIMYKESNDAKYHNELEILRILSGDLTKRYEAGTLPELVTDYAPMDVTWLNDGKFTDSIFFPNKALYNIDILSDIVLRDPHFLIQYAYLKLKSTPKYFINVAKLSLEDRVRMDTSRECEDTGEVVYFDEPHYLFSMNQKFIGPYQTDFRIFVDNYYLNPYIYTFLAVSDYFHFYIPCSLVKEDSMIELDKHPEYDFTRFVTFEDTEHPITVELPKTIKKIYAQDIILVEEDTRRYIPFQDYTLTAYSDIMEEDIILKPNAYATIKGKFHLQLNNSSYLNKKIRVFVNHRLTAKSIKPTDIAMETVPITMEVVNSARLTDDKIRVYCGGQMMPDNVYKISDTGRYLDKAEIYIFIDDEKAQERLKGVTVDQLPVGQRCEFHLDYIENEYGFIDTGEALTLPLDLKWYDIYVNGLKLNKSNIDIVTSNKFFVKGINSRKNLYIYARSDIYDEFDILHEETTENKLFHRIDEIYEELIKDRDVLHDTMTDIMDDLLINIIKHFEFVSDILEYSFINANEQQITPEIQQLYPELIDEYGILWLDTNTFPDAACVTMINSNKRSDFMKKDQYRYGWSPLFIGSHDDAKSGEYLCDPITGAPGMKNPDGSVIAYGELDRLSAHKSNFLNTLSFANLASLDVYQLQFNENTASRDVTSGENVLDEPVIIENTPVTTMVLSLDLQVLTKGYKNVMTYSDYVPMVEIQYTIGDSLMQTETVSADVLQGTKIDIYGNGVTIHSIAIKPANPDEPMTDVKCVLHSILLAI